MNAVAKRYARAAFGVANEQGGATAVSQLADALRAFVRALHDSRALHEALANPTFKAHRAALLAAVCEKLSVRGAAAKLIMLLSSNGRLALLDDIARAVEALADSAQNRLRAAVRSPLPLTDSQQKRLTQALEKRFGRSVVLDVAVAPELLAGLVVHVGDLTFDSSLRRQLESLTERLSANAS